ncbi:hypothetical protein CHISP_1120 [Chitinispirillum alkaliphilum]|nr:hypothetical protein CHISP_1120 [Chitinispirillum alkaliphilum]
MRKQTNQKWTTPGEVKKLLLARWKRGEFLREIITPSLPYPVEIPLKYPRGQLLGENFGTAREWAKLYSAYSGSKLPYSVKWSEINFREIGRNEIPVSVQFESLEKISEFIDKKKSLNLFRTLYEELICSFPKLKPWVYNKPFMLLEFAPVIHKLIIVTEWIVNHPRPAIYLRQISIPQIDTKFIEKHKRVIGEWLDILLDSSQIDEGYSGTRNFELRYGFLFKQPLIRFRILDPDLFIAGLSDMALPADQFCRLRADFEDVFITENDINGLCFPSRKRTIVIFGRGYGFDYLTNASWLKQKRIWYWGDIDTHGFAILNQFRVFFPHTQSFLMDRETLLAHKDYWVEEKAPACAKLENLRIQETALYEDLVKGRLGKAVRLEQELVKFEYLLEALTNTAKSHQPH